MKGDTCRENAIELKRIVAFAKNVNESEVDANQDLTDEIELFTENQFTAIEWNLGRSQTPETVERSMTILHTLQNGLKNHQEFGSDTVI